MTFPTPTARCARRAIVVIFSITLVALFGATPVIALDFAYENAATAPPSTQANAVMAPEESPRSLAVASTASDVARKSPPATLAVVEQPRATGYFVGDRVTQRVLLERDGYPVSPVSLPAPGRVSAWFERRATSVQTDASSHRWLAVDYQILNAPPKLITVKLPAWTLAVRGNAGAAVPALRIPEDLINVAPLSPPGSPSQVGAADLRPDHLPPVIATAPIRGAIETSAGALCLTLMAWVGWIVWRNRRAMATQPFASALREMRGLDDREPGAWQALHRAFDRTAGRVIQKATLPVLFERAPQFAPVRGEIEQFFARSSLLFFGAAGTAAPAVQPAPSAAITVASAAQPAAVAAVTAASALAPTRSGTGGPSLQTLCAELRRIEKRHER